VPLSFCCTGGFSHRVLRRTFLDSWSSSTDSEAFQVPFLLFSLPITHTPPCSRVRKIYRSLNTLHPLFPLEVADPDSHPSFTEADRFLMYNLPDLFEKEVPVDLSPLPTSPGPVNQAPCFVHNASVLTSSDYHQCIRNMTHMYKVCSSLRNFPRFVRH